MSKFEKCVVDDPLSRLALKDIYKLNISDSRIDLPAKIFRECEAMLSHIAERGIEVEPKLFDKLGVLSVGIKKRHTIPLSALMKLHSELALAIAPALPATAELMLWESRRSTFWGFLAPVKAIRYLMVFAFVAMVIFCSTLIFGGLTSRDISQSVLSFGAEIVPETERKTLLDSDNKPIVDSKNNPIKIAQGQIVLDPEGKPVLVQNTTIDWRKRLMLMIYFLSISGIGASFGALYDARSYVVSGQFDPRFANYTIRILLGLISGLLLAQVISEPLSATESVPDAHTLNSLSKSVLALLGGFAAQFVYTALKRMVEALESIFKPDAALKASIATYQKQVADEKAENEKQKKRNAELASIGGQLANAKTPEERKRLQDTLMNVVLDSDPGDTSSEVKQLEQQKLEADLKDIEDALEAKADLALLLPEDKAKEFDDQIAEWRQQIASLKQQGSRLLNVENAAAIASLAAVVLAFNPVGAVIGSGSTIITALLGTAAASRLPSLLRVMVAAGRFLDVDDYNKWKDVVLGQRGADASMSITDTIVRRAASLLRRVPVIGGILSLFNRVGGEKEEDVVKELIDEILKSDRASAIALLKSKVSTRDEDASELVDLLSSYLASEVQLGEQAKSKLSELVSETVDVSVEQLIDLARRAAASGQDGRKVIERLLSIADIVADDAFALTADDVETALNIVKTN